MEYQKYKNFVFLRVMKAVATEMRLEIIKILFEIPKISETDLAERLDCTLANISYHVNKLKTARFVKTIPDKNERLVTLVKNKNLHLNFNIIQILKKWYSEKTGEQKKKEKSFIEDILGQGKLSHLTDLLEEENE